VALAPVSDACVAATESCARRRAGIPEANRLAAAALEDLATGIVWIDPLEISGLDIENPVHSFEGLHLGRTDAELYFGVVADAVHGSPQTTARGEQGGVSEPGFGRILAARFTTTEDRGRSAPLLAQLFERVTRR
jgi:hypothetical protein